MAKQLITKVVSPKTQIATNKKQTEGSPLIRLMGDEFCSTAETVLFNLSSATPETGSGAFTNTGTVVFALDTDLGETVPTLDGSTQYLDLDHADHDVGTGSFTASIQFKSSTNTATDMLFEYGDTAASEQHYAMWSSPTGTLTVAIDDGTNIVNLADANTGSGDLYDGNWHTCVMVVDRTTDIMYIYVDGRLANSADISSVTGTLDNASTSLYIGAGLNSGTPDWFFTGQLANFHLIKAADYNAVQVLNQGYRSQVAVGTWNTLNTSTGRMNNRHDSTGDGNYTTTVIDVEEGIYEIQELHSVGGSNAISEIIIDDIVVTTNDRYNASSSENNSTVTKDISLSGGKHILKLNINSKNGSSGGFFIFNHWINLIKRDGHENGGTHKFFLLGDEIQQRRNDTNWNFIIAGTAYYNSVFYLDAANAEGGEWSEGDIFIKGGVYHITVQTSNSTDRGRLNIDFGNVEIFDEVDTSAGSGNVVNSYTVRLPQGKTTVRAAIGAATDGTDFEMAMGYIRGERVSD